MWQYLEQRGLCLRFLTVLCLRIGIFFFKCVGIQSASPLHVCMSVFLSYVLVNVPSIFIYTVSSNPSTYLTVCRLISCLSDVEECQLSECGGEEELTGGDSPLPRSSSTSDITQQLSDTLPGTDKHMWHGCEKGKITSTIQYNDLNQGSTVRVARLILAPFWEIGN